MQVRPHRSLALFTVVMALLPAGCGPRGDAATAPHIDACALLSMEDATAVLEMPVAEERPDTLLSVAEEDALVGACTWQTSNAERTLNVRVRRFDSVESAQSALSAVIDPIAAAGALTEVAGLGERAVFAFNELHLQSGSELVTITVAGLSGEAALRAARQASSIVLDGNR